MQLNVLQAKNQLSRLLAAAEAGEDVVIARNGSPVARLVPVKQNKGFTGFGSMKGKLGDIDSAFEVQTEKEVAQLFNGV